MVTKSGRSISSHHCNGSVKIQGYSPTCQVPDRPGSDLAPLGFSITHIPPRFPCRTVGDFFRDWWDASCCSNLEYLVHLVVGMSKITVACEAGKKGALRFHWRNNAITPTPHLRQPSPSLLQARRAATFLILPSISVDVRCTIQTLTTGRNLGKPAFIFAEEVVP